MVRLGLGQFRSLAIAQQSLSKEQGLAEQLQSLGHGAYRRVVNTVKEAFVDSSHCLLWPQLRLL